MAGSLPQTPFSFFGLKRYGRPYYKFSERTCAKEALRLLRIAQSDVAKGKTPMVVFNQVTLYDLAEDLLTDFGINIQKALYSGERYLKDSKKNFGNIRMTKITT